MAQRSGDRPHGDAGRARQRRALRRGRTGLRRDGVDAARERAQEHGVADRVVDRREHRDALVARLVAVAHRAQAQRAVGDRRFQFGVGARDARHAVDDAAGQHHVARPPAASLGIEGGESLRGALQCDDASGDDVRAVAFGLRAQPMQQRRSGDAEGEARAVVALRDPAGAASARIDDDDAAQEAHEVGRRGQPGWTCADDEAVEQLGIQGLAFRRVRTRGWDVGRAAHGAQCPARNGTPA
jgi:hypothetical protein